MRFDGYRAVWHERAARNTLLLGLIVRIPLWAGTVLLTLHVVSHLHRSYGAAGLLSGVVAVALSLSNPWRGRRLDRVGLRAALIPSLIVLTACWSIAPFLGYWPLLGLATLAGFFLVPTFSIVRQAVLHAVPDEFRTAALSIDSVLVEVSFMIGPALGVLLATVWPTSWALFTCELASIAGSVAIWIVNPALRTTREPGTPADGSATVTTGPPAGRAAFGIRSWVSTAVVAVLAMSAASTVVLNGTDVGVVAALRHLGHQPYIGWELAVWGLGSAIGGLVYGALHRPIPMPVLLTLLAATTVPVTLAREPVLLAVLLFVTGAFCAPTITASIDTLTRIVPERVRGEALGWHAAALTAGTAVGASVAGVSVDALGWRGGFLVPALIALALALAGALALRTGTRAGAEQTRAFGFHPAELSPAELSPAEPFRASESNAAKQSRPSELNPAELRQPR